MISRARPARPAKPPWALVLNVVLATLLGVACAPKSPPGSTTQPKRARKAERLQREAAARALQLATFDHAWQRIADTYPYRDFHGLDWQAVRTELRPRAEGCSTAAQLRPVLTEMLSRLGESHFQVLPGDGLPPAPTPAPAIVTPGDAPGREGLSMRGDLGLDVRLLDGRFVVTRADEDGPAAASGIRPGWEILAVGDTHAADVLRRAAASRSEAMTRYLGWAILNGAMRGEPGTATSVLASPPDGEARLLQLKRREPPGVMAVMGNLPDLVASLDATTLPGGAGYIRFNYFLMPVAQPFSDAVRGFIRDGAPGIVIDLRGNPGGIGGLVMGMAGHFIREPGRSLGAMKTREADLEFVANPRGPGAQFDGPVAILVDGLSLSTAELFAAGLQQLGRARVFGERTGGMALPSIVEGLPNGDRLQFAVADLTAPGGRRLEGIGVQPDEEVPLRRDDLVAGRDAALDAAVRWIMSASAAAPPGT